MKKIPLTIAGFGLLASLAPAANITFVSFHPGDNTPGTGAAGAGFTNAPDIGYTELLAASGHTVTRFVTHDNPTAGDLAQLNAADLVIIGRSVNSGQYNEEAQFWNEQVTSPVIIMSGYLLRSNRLNLVNGTTVPDTTGATRLIAAEPAHPVFNGISLDGTNTMVNTYNDLVPGQRGTAISMNGIVGGTLIASMTDDGTATANGIGIAEWAAGATVNNGHILAGPRMAFMTGSREAAGVSGETAGIFDLSADGTTMFLNAVNYMAVPEPSAALLAAFGLVGLLGRRRR